VLLKDKWRDFGSLLDLEVAERSALGRVSRLRILGTECSHAVEKDAIRWILSGGRIGTGGLNSTLFFIEKEGEGDELAFTFRGGGWGHGVGMCQEGARGRALSGQDYRAIISHYYPGTAIEKIK
jgi:stage II sporulation protein D